MAANSTAKGTADADDTPVGTIRPLEAGLPVEGRGPDDDLLVDDSHLDEEYVPIRPGRRRWLRRTVLGVALVVTALLGYYLVSLYQVWSTGRSDQARSVDAIVVLGAAQYDGRPSPQFQARLDHVVELWPQGHAALVVATGGSRPGDRFTEAETALDYLSERGVPESAILLENEGSSTYESLQDVAGLLEEQGLRSVLIVTDPFHALRSRLIAQEVGLTAYVSPTTSSVITGGKAWKHNLQEAGGVMLGRVIGFDHL